MSNSFLCAKGTVIRRGTASSRYMLDGLSSNNATPVIIDGVSTNESDLVMPIVLLGGQKILYSFGEDFGNVTVSGRVFLGPSSDGMQEAAKPIIEWYVAKRISKSKNYVKVSTLGSSRALAMYVVGLQLAVPDNVFNIQPFVVSGILVDLPKSS